MYVLKGHLKMFARMKQSDRKCQAPKHFYKREFGKLKESKLEKKGKEVEFSFL